VRQSNALRSRMQATRTVSAPPTTAHLTFRLTARYSSYMKKVPSRSRAGVNAAAVNGSQAMFSLLHAAHAIEKRLEDALEKAGLSNAKFAALTHLVEAGEPLSLSECAARMTCVRSNITQLIDRLEADGLVRRVDDPADRRGVKAMLTPLGIERQVAGAKQVDQVQKEVGRTLAGVDPTTLTRALSAFK
jgi:DNA-binding MarR family transcriptional regulator